MYKPTYKMENQLTEFWEFVVQFAFFVTDFACA